MTRRYTGNMHGEQFLANVSKDKLEVHDLDNEQVNCQIDEIIRAHHEKPYNTLAAAKPDGFDPCKWCLPGSRR